MRSLVRTLTIYSRASVGLMVTAVTMERKAEWEGGTGISLTLKQHTQNPRALIGLEREKSLQLLANSFTFSDNLDSLSSPGK